MINSTFRTEIQSQIRDLIVEHLREVSRYLTGASLHPQHSAQIIDDLENLANICQIAPEDASPGMFYAAHAALTRIDDFLRLINQDCDMCFCNTSAGMIWQRATMWCETVRRLYSHVSLDQVWDVITPAVPDTLNDIGGGIYEAIWAAPVPPMDIEILNRTPQVEVQGTPFEPEGIPNGVAVHFSLNLVQ
jgi:hypothetical protein